MLSPKEFEQQYPADELAEELPDKPISSLRDIQYLYGKLYTLATAGGGKYAPYLTPDAARDLVDESDSLVVVRLDLSGNEPQLADDQRGPVWVTKYTRERVSKVAHCYYANKGSGIDHSLSHKSGSRKSKEKIAKYATDRLTRWPTEDAVKRVATNHEDGWILQQLIKAGKDEKLLTEVSEDAKSKLPEKTTALVTVTVKIEAEGDYLWPNEIDCINEGMRQQRLSKLVSKGKAEDSAGEAIDFISGQKKRTVGTADDPLNYFLGKQLEKFPGHNPDKAWRTHPISEDAAVTLMNAGTFINACTYRTYTTFGATIYYLPYFFGVPEPDETHLLYRLLYSIASEGNSSEQLTPIENAYQYQKEKLPDNTDDADRLRFYISAMLQHQSSRYDVIGETINGLTQYPADLAFVHEQVVQTAAFREGRKRTGALPHHENWQLLDGGNILRSVASGSYLYQTLPSGDDDTDASADDFRIRALVAILSGESIPVSSLLERYVERIIEDSRDDENGFPVFLVASQYAQLCALARTDHEFLTVRDANDALRPITNPPTYGSQPMQSRPEKSIPDGGFVGATKLESFIEDTPALAENDERCASFLLGALVGAVGDYQEYEQERSTTLVDQFPVKAVTRNRVKKVAEDAIEKAVTYTRQEKKGGRSYPGMKFDYIADRLREKIIRPDPDDWTIDTDDLRFYYALGVTYGMNDRKIRSNDTDEQPEATPK